jgi:hypothetical protein
MKEKPNACHEREKHYNLSKHWKYEHWSNNTVAHPTELEYKNDYFLSYITSAHNKPFKEQW